MNKKAYMRTIEVMVAIMLAVFFMTYLLNQRNAKEEKDMIDLSSLQSDDAFRSCAVRSNHTCMNQIVSAKLPKTYEYRINDTEGYYPDVSSKKDVFTEPFLFSGTIDNFTMKKTRIFYWKR